MKVFLALLALVGIGSYFAGAFDTGYSRDVGRSQAQVMAALADLDITAQPGAPGSTAEAAGGVKPVFRLEKAADHMSWYVMSGEQVAMKMTATFEPLDDGNKTRVRAKVERGDAPDDLVSPAFRSTGLTMGLFGMALEGEINKLTTRANYDARRCKQLLADFEVSNIRAGSMDRPDNLTQAVGQTGKTMMRLSAMEAELRRNGCPTDRLSGSSHTDVLMDNGDESADEREPRLPGSPDVIPSSRAD